MSHIPDHVAAAAGTAHERIRAVAASLGTDESRAYRVPRAWLHTVRDQLGVAGSAHLAAQQAHRILLAAGGMTPPELPPHYARITVASAVHEPGDG